jgi:hypothetical protein
MEVIWGSFLGRCPMSVRQDIYLKLSAQRALLGAVTRQLRSVSVDLDAERSLIRLRFIFDGEPSEWEREIASIASTEIISDFADGWVFDEKFVSCPAPDRMEHLRMLVYLRNEEGSPATE